MKPTESSDAALRSTPSGETSASAMRGSAATAAVAPPRARKSRRRSPSRRREIGSLESLTESSVSGEDRFVAHGLRRRIGADRHDEDLETAESGVDEGND